jgi:hypothetical protein
VNCPNGGEKQWSKHLNDARVAKKCQLVFHFSEEEMCQKTLFLQIKIWGFFVVFYFLCASCSWTPANALFSP